MAEIKNKTSPEKETSINEWKPLSTDIELMAFFEKKPGLSGLINEENYKAPSLIRPNAFPVTPPQLLKFQVPLLIADFPFEVV